MKVEIAGFDGVVPRMSPTMLGNNQAQQADNVKLYSREIRPWNAALTAQQLPFIAKTIFRLYNGPTPLWLAWQNEVDVVPGPLADLTQGRFYYTGDGVPKKSNYVMATNGGGQAPNTFLNMGVPGPSLGPAVSLTAKTVSTQFLSIASNVVADDNLSLTATENFQSTGTHGADTTTSSYNSVTKTWTLTLGSSVAASEDGSISKSPTQPISRTVVAAGFAPSDDVAGLSNNTIETRAYVNTFVSQFGDVYEESAPSPPSILVNVNFGQAVTVSGFAPPPSGSYNIVSRRIYRTFTGNISDGYEFVAEIPLAQTSYTDALLAASLGGVLSTNDFLPPPDNLTGLVALSNGCLAGFVNNTIYFSQPYLPHAWPLANAINIPYKVIGLGAVGTTLVVCTDRFPYIIDGSQVGAMSAQLIQLDEPCISKKSIVSDALGVIYASPNGLVSIGLYQRRVMTEALFRRDEWQAVDPTSFKAVMFDNRYWGVYVTGDTTRKALVLSRDDIPSLSFLDVNATATHLDDRTGSLYFASAKDNNIYLHAGDPSTLLKFTWRSKRFATPMGVTLSALKVDAAFDKLGTTDFATALAAATAANANLFNADLLGAVNSTPVNTLAVDGSTLQNLPLASAYRSLQVLLYQEMPPVLVAQFSMKSLDPVRIPPFKTRNLEIQIVGDIAVRSITLAPTVEELRV